MPIQRYVRKITDETHGELYQFLERDTETGEEEAVNPFYTGVFQEMVQETLPEILSIQSKRGADATGYFQGNSFIVQKGSKFAASTSPKCPKKYIKLREGLILDGILIPLHQQLFLLEDVEFDSPGSAMGTVIGGWGRGPHAWKEAGKG